MCIRCPPGYLEAAGTRLSGGRDVSWHDTAKTPYVAIVNETFARQMWGETRAMGQRFLVAGNLTEVVGVAEDGKYHDLTETSQPAVYLPLMQSRQSETVFVVRSLRTTERDGGGVAAYAERHGARCADNAAELDGRILKASCCQRGRRQWQLGVMGLLAAMLAATGIFGMAAYSVSRRMKELGIRVALGAGKRHVMSAAVGRPMVLLGIGSTVGLLAAMFASRLMRQIVYQADTGDPVVIGGAVLTMVVLGVAASAIPAGRALAVEPSKVMREE